MTSAIVLVLSVVLLVLAIARLRLHPFLALLLAGIGYGASSGMPLPDVAAAIGEGFGKTIGSIGIVIIAGTIIGTFLERSGGALALAERVLRVTGRTRVPLAMSIVGSIVSIPVFCDSGFVILQPLNKALSKRVGISLAGPAIALSLGLLSTHTLVPPTPGPVGAAGILGADLGRVILVGLPVAFAAMIAGWLFATRCASRVAIDPMPEGSGMEAAEDGGAPPAWLAAAPIVVPLLLIVGKSVAKLTSEPLGAGWLQGGACFVGEPVIALLVGVGIAAFLPRRFSWARLSSAGWVGEAIVASAMIIAVTGAGGSFGKVLEKSGVAKEIGEALSKAHLGIWLPFIVAAAIKTAQGSSTVALIATASLVEPLLAPLGLDSEMGRAIACAAIGAGSMVVSHANDSYFWVVTQMSRMDVRTGVRLQTAGTAAIGLVAGIAVWAMSAFFL
ncbi:MAG: GntP family permease [Planctomycetes bacterium]|nr:GntP family permease [Planctomycetota bacterium]